MDRTAGIFAARITDGVMRREGFADRHEGFPLVAHQMGPRVHRLAQHSVCLTLGEIRHDMGSGVAGGDPSSTDAGRCTTCEHGCLRCPGLAFPSPAEMRTVGVIAWAAADVELIHLDSAIERLLAGQQQP